MTELDVATGLPALPEGWRWEVRGGSHEYLYYTMSALTIPPSVRLQRSATTSVIETTDWPEGRYYPRSFWGWLTRKPRVERPLPEPTTAWADVLTGDLDEITPEAILTKATEVWEEYLELETSRALLGAYPPKRLVQEDATDD